MDDLHYLTLWISNFMEAVLLRRLSFSFFLFELRNYRAIEPSLFIKLIKVFYNLYHSNSSMLWIFLFADLIFQFFLPLLFCYICLYFMSLDRLCIQLGLDDWTYSLSSNP